MILGDIFDFKKIHELFGVPKMLKIDDVPNFIITLQVHVLLNQTFNQTILLGLATYSQNFFILYSPLLTESTSKSSTNF